MTKLLPIQREILNITNHSIIIMCNIHISTLNLHIQNSRITFLLWNDTISMLFATEVYLSHQNWWWRWCTDRLCRPGAWRNSGTSSCPSGPAEPDTVCRPGTPPPPRSGSWRKSLRLSYPYWETTRNTSYWPPSYKDKTKPLLLTMYIGIGNLIHVYQNKESL